MVRTRARHIRGGDPQEPRRSIVGSVLRGLAFLLVVALAWPITFGGLFGGVIVSGQSMEPTMIAGDLVLIRRTAEVDVGDVVVYRPEVQPNARVIHRIIDRDGPELVLQGDNNSWIDPFDVVVDDVEGIAIATVPRVGSWLSQLSNPLLWGSCLVLGAGWWWIRARREQEA